jgi:hypothetical protein
MAIGIEDYSFKLKINFHFQSLGIGKHIGNPEASGSILAN